MLEKSGTRRMATSEDIAMLASSYAPNAPGTSRARQSRSTAAARQASIDVRFSVADLMGL